MAHIFSGKQPGNRLPKAIAHAARKGLVWLLTSQFIRFVQTFFTCGRKALSWLNSDMLVGFILTIFDASNQSTATALTVAGLDICDTGISSFKTPTGLGLSDTQRLAEESQQALCPSQMFLSQFNQPPAGTGVNLSHPLEKHLN